MSRRSAPLLLVALACCWFRWPSHGVDAQSLTYSKGQNVAPAYEGWEQSPDGTRYFLFGYMNRNWEEEIDVPVGAGNGFNIGGFDRGQPTHFLPRRNRFVFRVPVPEGFTVKDELIWTLTTHGTTEKAYATLRPDYIVDDVVKASETGALGAGTSSPEVRGNKPPLVRVEELASRSVRVGQAVTLVSEVKDDGIPKPRDPARVAAAQARAAAQSSGTAPANTPPRNPALSPPTRITVGKTVGLHVSWFLYRGPGTVTFDPQVQNGLLFNAGSTHVIGASFAAPGFASVSAASDQQVQNVKFGIVTINEVRGEMGLPRVEWGDKPWLPLQWAPSDFKHREDYAMHTGRNREVHEEEVSGQ